MTNILRQEDWPSRRAPNRLQRRSGRARGHLRQGGRVFPSIIISASDDNLVVRAEVPGMKLEDFEIGVSGDVLTVQGSRVTGQNRQEGWYHRRERESGGFSRAVQLPVEVDGDKAEATYKAGVLTVSLPLKQAAKPRQVPVKVVEG
ncbi:MAG: Hsp20/alpha crystallin family protein [Anaerolineae bacterium]